jgi:hypothetical protein
MGKTKLNNKIYRDAGDGKFVTKQYASTHPKTTVAETSGKSKGSK